MKTTSFKNNSTDFINVLATTFCFLRKKKNQNVVRLHFGTGSACKLVYFTDIVYNESVQEENIIKYYDFME